MREIGQLYRTHSRIRTPNLLSSLDLSLFLLRLSIKFLTGAGVVSSFPLFQSPGARNGGNEEKKGMESRFSYYITITQNSSSVSALGSPRRIKEAGGKDLSNPRIT